MKRAFAAGAAIALVLGLAATAQAKPFEQHTADRFGALATPMRPAAEAGWLRGDQGRADGQIRAPGPAARVMPADPRQPYATGPGAQRQFRPADRGRVQYDARVFRRTIVVQQRFRLAPRLHPAGWYAHRWVYGEHLPWGWFTPAFYLSWANYGLPAPPVGCEWVQEGTDAVLVDIWTGQVMSVVPDVFWW